MTRVPYYGLFLMFPELYLVFPLDCVILRSLLDSRRWYGPASALRAPLIPLRLHLRSTVFA